jgi:hypothetical protein
MELERALLVSQGRRHLFVTPLMNTDSFLCEGNILVEPTVFPRQVIWLYPTPLPVSLDRIHRRKKD